MEEESKSKLVFRWIAFLPAALLAAWLAWFVVMLGNKVAVGMQGTDPDSFLARAFNEFISHAALGATFVYAGAKVESKGPGSIFRTQRQILRHISCLAPLIAASTKERSRKCW